MADSGQTYKNHTRFFPPFHFIAAPILLLNFINSLRHVWLTPNRSTAFAALVAFGFVMGLLAARLMALKVQDRVIRMELQLRMRGCLPADLQSRMHELTPAQMVALPETVAVGLALTVTTALPLEVPPTQALASEMATTV